MTGFEVLVLLLGFVVVARLLHALVAIPAEAARVESQRSPAQTPSSGAYGVAQYRTDQRNG